REAMDMKLSRLFPVVAASAGALALSACGGGGTTNAASSSTPSSSPTATTTVTTATSSPASTPAAPPAAQPVDNGLCKSGDVKLSLGQGDAGAGSVYKPLLITNSSAKPCTI